MLLFSLFLCLEKNSKYTDHRILERELLKVKHFLAKKREHRRFFPEFLSASTRSFIMFPTAAARRTNAQTLAHLAASRAHTAARGSL
jgi:hypothetical protein